MRSAGSESNFSAKRLARLAAITALALVLHVAEGWIPPLPVPGARLGLANIVTLWAIIRLGFADAAFITFGRIALGSLLGGTALSLLYSVSGGLFALISMALAWKLRGSDPHALTAVGVSVAGAFFHHLGQLCAAAIITKSAAIFAYLPLLTAISIPTGVFVGMIAGMLAARVPLNTKN